MYTSTYKIILITESSGRRDRLKAYKRVFDLVKYVRRLLCRNNGYANT